jgi:hypoxanthine phosphoribosyltransferase
MAKLSTEVLLSEKEIKARVEELAKEISREYEGKQITIVGILKGSFVFVADLMRHFSGPVTCEFIRVKMTDAQHEIPRSLNYSTPFEPEGKHILVVEDILDTGITLDYLVNQLQARKPATLKICVLLDKAEARKIDIKADYTGFQIPNRFVVGYGLDYEERYRELPYITWIE